MPRRKPCRLPDELAPPLDTDAHRDLRAMARNELPLHSARVLARLIRRFECWERAYRLAQSDTPTAPPPEPV